MSDTSAISVFTPALAAATIQIDTAAANAHQVALSTSDAMGYTDPLEIGGPADFNGALKEMLQNSYEVIAYLENACRELARNTSMAAQGYLDTDQGVIPLYGTKGGAGGLTGFGFTV